jgi:creatine kinase
VEKNFVVWVNDQDHATLSSWEYGSDMKSTFTRFVLAAKTCEEVVKKEGYEFMKNDHMGYIVGGINQFTASAALKLPLLSAKADFQEVCAGLNLQATPTGGGFEISNKIGTKLGKTEVELANVVIEGCAKLIEMEKKLG